MKRIKKFTVALVCSLPFLGVGNMANATPGFNVPPFGYGLFGLPWNMSPVYSTVFVPRNPPTLAGAPIPLNSGNAFFNAGYARVQQYIRGSTARIVSGTFNANPLQDLIQNYPY